MSSCRYLFFLVLFVSVIGWLVGWLVNQVVGVCSCFHSFIIFRAISVPKFSISVCSHHSMGNKLLNKPLPQIQLPHSLNPQLCTKIHKNDG